MDALFTRISSIIIFMLPFLCLQATTLKADDEKGKANELPKVALILGFNPSPEAAIIQNILGTILEKKGFAQVERNQIDKLFPEVELNFSAENVKDPSSQKWLGAGILILIGDNAKGKSLSVIAMETETGNELAKIAVPADAKSPALDNKLKDFADSIRKKLQDKSRDLPTATVLYVTDNSTSLRLRDFQSEIEKQVVKLLEEKGYLILRRQKAFTLSEETSLSFAGFMNPNFTVLPKPCDIGVAISYEEKPSEKLDFEHTPVSVSVDLLIGAESKNLNLILTPPELSKINEKIADQIPAASEFKDKFLADPEAMAEKRRTEAKKMLDTLLKKSSEPLDARSVELCRRIIYLDPQARDAYYLLARSIGIGYGGYGHIDDSAIEGISAMRKFLDFPDGNLVWRHRAYQRLIEAYSSLILYITGKDDTALQFFNNELVRIEIERVNWMAKSAQSKHGDSFTSIMIYRVRPTALPPEKDLALYDWAANALDGNNTIDNYDRAVYHLSAANKLDEAKKYDKAAQHLYKSMMLGGLTSGILCSDLGNLTTEGNAIRLSKYLDKDQAEALINKVRGLRPPPQNKSIESLKVMYGDFMSTLGSNRDSLHTVGIFFLYDYRNPEPINDAKLEAVAMPPGVKSLGRIFLLSDSLWTVANSDKVEPSLYFYGPAKKPEWKKISLPAACHKSIIDVKHVCQAGDNVFWDGDYIPKDTSKPMDRENTPPAQSLMVYNLKTGKADSYSLEDGLPSDYIKGLSPDKSDPGATWVVTVISSGGPECFFSKFKDGRFYMNEKSLKRTYGSGVDPLSVTFVNNLIFTTEYGEDGLWRGKDGNFAKIIDEKWRCKLPVPDFFTSYSDSPKPSQKHIAVSDDRIFAATGGGFYELDLQGNIIKKWYPDCFVFWENLCGIIKGNCSLPGQPNSLVQDDINPNLIWLVKLQPENTKNSPQYITAYDSKTGKWSKPIRIEGKDYQGQPLGDYWYFAADNTFCRIPKSEWNCDLSFNSKAEPEFIVADTLHGRASKALLKKDFAETEKLLKEAVEKNIAPNITNSMLQKLPELRKKDQ